MEIIYLDNAATAFPKSEAVYRAIDRAGREYAVSAGRSSHTLSRRAADVIAEAREELLRLSGAPKGAEAVFAPSATIACNQIFGGISWKKEDVAYVSACDHNAVIRVLHHLSRQYGFTVAELAVDPATLQPDPEHIAYQFRRKSPSVVAVAHVGNVLGNIQPVAQVCALAARHGALTVVDGAQALGLVPVCLRDMAVDFYIFAGHKTLCGPYGAGGYVNCRGAVLKPYLAGGTGSDSLSPWMNPGISGAQEPGSADVPAIAGLCASVREIRETVERSGNPAAFLERESGLAQRLAARLGEIPGVTVYRAGGPGEQTGIVAFNIEGFLADEAGTLLDAEYGIAVRSGYQCAPLIHRYLGSVAYGGVIRAGIGRFTAEEDTGHLVRAVKELAENA